MVFMDMQRKICGSEKAPYTLITHTSLSSHDQAKFLYEHYSPRTLHLFIGEHKYLKYSLLCE